MCKCVAGVYYVKWVNTDVNRSLLQVRPKQAAPACSPLVKVGTTFALIKAGDRATKKRGEGKCQDVSFEGLHSVSGGISYCELDL